MHLHFNLITFIYSRLEISRIRISRILQSSKRLSESKIHFDCFLQPWFGVGDFFTSANYPKCKLICTSGNLNLVKNSRNNFEISRFDCTCSDKCDVICEKVPHCGTIIVGPDQMLVRLLAKSIFLNTVLFYKYPKCTFYEYPANISHIFLKNYCCIFYQPCVSKICKEVRLWRAQTRCM